MAITRNDVARLAGVSSATVSYVINNGPRPVSDETRQKVLQAVEILDYQPSAVARSLRTKKTATIGVIVSDILNPLLSAIAKGIEDTILPQNYNMILCNSDEDPDRELNFLNMLLSKQVDGIILQPTCENQRFLFSIVQQRKIPVVLIDRQIQGLPVDCLLLENFSGVYQVTKELIKLGHRRIAFISLPRRLTPGQERASGYERALQDAGIPLKPELLMEGGFKSEEAYELVSSIFKLSNPPTALIASSNRLLNGVLEYVKDNNLCIPKDFSLAVFDDIPTYRYFNPSITAIHTDAEAFGCKAASLLEGQIFGQRTHEQRIIRFPVELIIRESTIAPQVP